MIRLISATGRYIGRDNWLVIACVVFIWFLAIYFPPSY
jgi:hypothetical protein